MRNFDDFFCIAQKELNVLFQYGILVFHVGISLAAIRKYVFCKMDEIWIE